MDIFSEQWFEVFFLLQKFVFGLQVFRIQKSLWRRAACAPGEDGFTGPKSAKQTNNLSIVASFPASFVPQQDKSRDESKPCEPLIRSLERLQDVLHGKQSFQQLFGSFIGVSVLLLKYFSSSHKCDEVPFGSNSQTTRVNSRALSLNTSLS